MATSNNVRTVFDRWIIRVWVRMTIGHHQAAVLSFCQPRRCPCHPCPRPKIRNFMHNVFWNITHCNTVYFQRDTCSYIQHVYPVTDGHSNGGSISTAIPGTLWNGSIPFFYIRSHGCVILRHCRVSPKHARNSRGSFFTSPTTPTKSRSLCKAYFGFNPKNRSRVRNSEETRPLRHVLTLKENLNIRVSARISRNLVCFGDCLGEFSFNIPSDYSTSSIILYWEIALLCTRSCAPKRYIV